MPRPKRVKEDRIVGSFRDQNGDLIEIQVIDEKTESFGRGAHQKVKYMRLFKEALDLIERVYYLEKDPKEKEKFKKLIYGSRSKTRLVHEFQKAGIVVDERPGRDLATVIQKTFKALDAALAAKNDGEET